MGNDKLQKISDYFGPQYDSDEDLPEDERKKIKDSYHPDKDRQAAWDKADMYPKIKKFVKGAWYGDKRNKQE
jgi:hypothetical protein